MEPIHCCGLQYIYEENKLRIFFKIIDLSRRARRMRRETCLFLSVLKGVTMIRVGFNRVFGKASMIYI